MIKLKTATDHRNIWNKKPVLRYLYKKWYKMIYSSLKDIPDGLSLELGSGCGNIKDYTNQTISSDIQFNNWLDAVIDGQHIPFKNDSISSISMIDVLHHIPCPKKFLSEAYNVLKPGGKIVIIEPYPTILSNIFYKLFHNEPVNKKQSILLNKNNFTEPNQAASFILFNKEKAIFESSTSFKILSQKYFSTIIYPLSGGYKNYSLVPIKLIPFLEFFEKVITPFNKFISFRTIVILQKG